MLLFGAVHRMLGPLVFILIKTFVLILPLTVFWLAVRRLALSSSANAWLYAATSIFSFLTALGLAPWVFGGTSHPVFFVFSAMAPAIWYGVVTLCNSTRSTGYDSDLERTFLRFADLARIPRRSEPLVLEDPEWPEVPLPVFRHSRPDSIAEPAETAPKPEAPGRDIATRISRASEGAWTLLSVARNMRGHASSERRRIKLLPPPDRAEDRKMSFLRQTESA